MFIARVSTFVREIVSVLQWRDGNGLLQSTSIHTTLLFYVPKCWQILTTNACSYQTKFLNLTTLVNEYLP